VLVRAVSPKTTVVRDNLADAHALITRDEMRIDDNMLVNAPHLKVIARMSVGFNTVDVEAATKRGILVMNAPGANSVSVAELAMAHLLALSRGIAAADAAMKRGIWDKKKLVGAELRGKTLGIVGLGRIGQEVAARARNFGMVLVAHDPYISEQVAQSLDMVPLAEGVESEGEYVFLRSNGCRLAQGFWFAHPMPADELESLASKPLPC
jgi:D-3-phosphoglycerate dehydrogenase